LFVIFSKTPLDDGKEVESFEIKEFKRTLGDDALIHPEDLDKIKAIAQGTGNQKNEIIEIRVNENYERSSERLWRLKEIQYTNIYNEQKKPSRVIGTMRDITEEQKREQELIDKTKQDSLTGLLNQKAMREAVEEILKDKSQIDHGIMMIIDLDHFKKINDTMGHLYGNAILISISKILKTLVEPKGIVGRIGGDEFSIFLKNTDKISGAEKAKEIIERVRALYVVEDEKQPFSCSIGLSIYSDYSETYDDLFERADIALYAIKKSEKSNFIFYFDIEDKENYKLKEYNRDQGKERLEENYFTDQVTKIISRDMENQVYASISQHFERLTRHDSLTVLGNFTKFREEASNTLKKYPDKTFAVIYSDFNNFKYFNERFGYEQGDYVLKSFGEILLKEEKKGAIVARMMADHFIGLKEVGNPGDLIRYIRNVNNNFCKKMNEKYDGANLSMRVGLYILEDENESISAAVDRAGIAKNAVVRSVRTNNCMLYNEKLAKKISWENNITGNMNDALNHQEFVVYLQPKVDLKTNHTIGAEALVRWIKPNGTIISPNDFIPIFENNGFIVQLDYYIIDCVLKIIKAWKEAGKFVIPISINISRIHA
ncbi:MAG: diguanylate cyclase, partial [Eubacterium sp.]